MAKLIVLLFLISQSVNAQIRTEPTEIIEATALTAFSERSGYWPSSLFHIDTTPIEFDNVADFLNTVPGVQARENGSPTVSIRGSAQATRVLSLVDDIPLNLPDGLGAPTLLLPREVLSEVDLFKGPASVFYGSSAMAGAINYRLRKFDRAAIRGLIADDGGQFGTRSVFGVLPIRFSRKNDFLQLSAFQETAPGEFLFQSTTQNTAGRRTFNNSSTQRYTLSGEQGGDQFKIRERAIIANSIGATPGSLTFPTPSFFNNWVALGSADLSTKISEQLSATIRGSSLYSESTYDAGTSSAAKAIASKNAVNLDSSASLAEHLMMKSFADYTHGELQASYNDNQQDVEDSVEIGQSFEYNFNEFLTLVGHRRVLS